MLVTQKGRITTWPEWFAFCFLCHTYSTVYNASKWRYIQFSFPRCVSSWILPHFAPFRWLPFFCRTAFCRCFSVFFSGSGLLLLNIISHYDHCPKDTGTWGKSSFWRWQQAPLFILFIHHKGNIISFSWNVQDLISWVSYVFTWFCDETNHHSSGLHHQQ